MNQKDQETFSFESCQEDHFFFPFDSDFYQHQYFREEESIFMDESEINCLSSSNKGTQQNSFVSESSSEISLESIKIDEIVQESNTNDSFKTSESEIYHYRNLRRKKQERGRLEKIYKMGSKFAFQTSDSENVGSQKLTSKLTKNLLAFGKKPLLNVIRGYKKGEYFLSNKWLMDLEKKDGINMDDYDKIYKCGQLRGALSQFFRKKIIERELMISRTKAENKIFYRYYLEVFERNFHKGGFKSISETMREIQKQKPYF